MESEFERYYGDRDVEIEYVPIMDGSVKTFKMNAGYKKTDKRLYDIMELIGTFRKLHEKDPLDAESVTIMFDLLNEAFGNPVALAT